MIHGFTWIGHPWRTSLSQERHWSISWPNQFPLEVRADIEAAYVEGKKVDPDEGSLQLYFPPADWFPGRLMCLTAPFLEMLGRKYWKIKIKIKIQNRSPQNQKKVCRQKRKKINRRERKEQTEESHCRTAGACASLRESLARSLTLLCHKGKRRTRGGKTHFFIAKAHSQD